MSTAIAHDISIPLPAPGRRGVAPGRRGHLRLVGAGEPALPQAQRASTRPTTLRLTRRGRLALTTTAALVVALVAVSMIGLLGPAGATTSVVVEPGSTLSQIAAEQLPDMPLSQAITDIQRANRLSTTSVAAGQELIIPGR